MAYILPLCHKRAIVKSVMGCRAVMMEIASGKSVDQLFQKIAQLKAIFILSAILAKRGKLNLELILYLYGYKIL